MNAVDVLCDDLRRETDAIWLDEPPEIRAMRLGCFESDAGSYGQYFSNLVFVNGDMRALSTWITPAVVLRVLDDSRFSVEQCKDIFAWTNLVNVDFLAYCGFVRFGEFVHRIVGVFPEVETKDEFQKILEAWYAYANRMYLWVHHAFPWGIGTAFTKRSEDDLHFMREQAGATEVKDYFERHGRDLVKAAQGERSE